MRKMVDEETLNALIEGLTCGTNVFPTGLQMNTGMIANRDSSTQKLCLEVVCGLQEQTSLKRKDSQKDTYCRLLNNTISMTHN